MTTGDLHGIGRSLPMLVEKVQRWRSGRELYRLKGEAISVRDYEVASLKGDRQAKDFACKHHYSRSYPAARERMGLYHHGQLVGVAVFSMPMQGAVLDLLPCPRDEAVELGRFVLVDEVPSNGESWFIARCFELLKKDGYAGVVSYSDPVPRHDAQGQVVMPGHLGIIYQATNAIYTGRSSPRTLRLLPDGTCISDRALSKIRKRDKGWRYAVDQLVAHGAPVPNDSVDLGAWLSEVLPQVSRTVRHPGCHRYVWALTRKHLLLPQLARKGVQTKPYPKML